MIFQMTHPDISGIEEKMYGKLIYQLSLLSLPNDNFAIERSLVIDNDSFLSYKQTSFLPEGLVEKTVKQLELLQVMEADFYPSFYIDCMVDPTPITCRVTETNVQNAIVAIYNRWFDGKPYAQRKIRHLEDSDTYPAILIQPHCTQELTMITRHPNTGKLIRGNDGAGLVHCSKPSLDVAEEKTITAIDKRINQPVKVFYYKETKNNYLTVRRVEAYPMTSDARINYVFSKSESADIAIEDLLNTIHPEDLVSVYTDKYMLTAVEQFSGIDATPGLVSKGEAVFPWTDQKAFPESPIFLSTEITLEDTNLLRKCRGAVFSQGGMTSHGASVCRMNKIKCITSASNLEIDFKTKRSFVKIYEDNDPSVVHEYKEIIEGDTICLAGDKWSLGGDILPYERYVPKASLDIRQRIGKLLKPFTQEDTLKNVPLDKQMHIARLIKVMKETGWKI